MFLFSCLAFVVEGVFVVRLSLGCIFVFLVFFGGRFKDF